MQKYKSVRWFGCVLVYLAAMGVNAVTIESKNGRGAVKVTRGRDSRVELTGGE